MANQSLLTYNAKVSQAELTYYSPVSVLQNTNQPISTTYFFLSKVEPWPDDNNPPVPTQDQKTLKRVYKNMFAAKQIYPNNICPVIERRDWVADTIYDYYQDNIDMFEVDAQGLLVLNFYVKNRYDQVFKCLWNNNGAPSTVEPFFEPGTYGTNNIFQGTDGYKWKYIYTVDTALKVTFMDNQWMPVPVLGETPSALSTSAGSGDIEVINVLDGGSGYDPANSVVTVSITGDGTGAAASPVINGGVITDIIVTNAGSNYTYANASIITTPSIGSGATLSSPVSPIAGHGYDPVSELGVSRIMFSVEFNGSESGAIPTDIDYHQVGLIINPVTLQSNPYPANGAIYKTTTDFIVAPGFGSYVNDEFIYQGTSLENSTFSARVLSFDQASNVVKLINILGTPTINTPVFGNSSGTTRTLLSYSSPEFQIFSGYLCYVENRTGIQRSADGIEQFKVILGY